MPWAFQTCFDIRCESCLEAIDLLQGRKVGLSITVRIISQFLDRGRAVLKS
jgi:hypothetical protein